MRDIRSRDNPHFKALRKLADSGRERRKAGLVLLDGLHLIESYADSVGVPDEAVVSDAGAGRREIAAWLAAHPRVRQTRLADALFAELSPVETPTGILALAPMPTPAAGPRSDRDAVLLDGVQDPGNLGSILRTAAAAGFRQVLLSGDCAQAWSPKTLRAAMGAHFLLDVHEACDLCGFIAAFRGETVVTALDAEGSLYDVALDAPVAWIFGSEGQGVRPVVAAAATRRVRIPMPGGTESLNVAAAAAICLFETVRRRPSGPPAD